MLFTVLQCNRFDLKDKCLEYTKKLPEEMQTLPVINVDKVFNLWRNELNIQKTKHLNSWVVCKKTESHFFGYPLILLKCNKLAIIS